MFVVESKACCEDDAQYIRLQGLMARIDIVSPTDVIALMRKCTTVIRRDIRDGELVLLSALARHDLEVVVEDRERAEANYPSPRSLK